MQKVFCVSQRVSRVDKWLVPRVPERRGGQSRHLGDQPHRRLVPHHRIRNVLVRRRVERRQRRDDRAEH